MKKKRRAKRRLIFLLVIAILAVLLLFLLFAPLFNITAIEVEGSSKYSVEKIIETSGIIIGENGFRLLPLKPEAILELRLLDSEERICRLPFVKTSTVKLIFPNKVLITITEREPAAYLVYFDNYLIVDELGFVLEVQNQKPSGTLKEIRGIDFSQYSVGGQLEASDISLIRTGVTIINTIKTSDDYSNLKLLEVLDWVDMVSGDSAMISLDKRIIVRFDPMDKLQYTIDFTKEIFFKKISSKDTGRIEFSGDQNPSFIPD